MRAGVAKIVWGDVVGFWNAEVKCIPIVPSYFGETGRPLKKMFAEQHPAVKRNDANPPVSKQFNNGSHCTFRVYKFDATILFEAAKIGTR